MLFTHKTLSQLHFFKVGSIGIFADFGEKLGVMGEKSREKAIQKSIHRKKDFKPMKFIFEVYQMKNLPIDWDSVPDVMNKVQFFRL